MLNSYVHIHGWIVDCNFYNTSTYSNTNTTYWYINGRPILKNGHPKVLLCGHLAIQICVVKLSSGTPMRAKNVKDHVREPTPSPVAAEGWACVKVKATLCQWFSFMMLEKDRPVMTVAKVTSIRKLWVPGRRRLLEMIWLNGMKCLQRKRKFSKQHNPEKQLVAKRERPQVFSVCPIPKTLLIQVCKQPEKLPWIHQVHVY